jgi:hypothetical protein
MIWIVLLLLLCNGSGSGCGDPCQQTCQPANPCGCC